MKYFSEVHNLLETIKPFESQKHLTDRAMASAVIVTLPIWLLGFTFGIIYKYAEPDIDKNTVSVFLLAWTLSFYAPYFVAFLIMIYSLTSDFYRFFVRLGKSQHPYKLLKKIFRYHKRYGFRQRQQKHDRENVIKLGQKLTLAELKYIKANLAYENVKNKKWVTNFFAVLGILLPALITLLTQTKIFNVMSEFLSPKTNSQHFILFVIIGLIVLTFSILGVSKYIQKVRNNHYREGVLEQTIVEQQAIADRQSQDEHLKILYKIEHSLEALFTKKVNKQPLMQRLLYLFTGH